MGPKFKVYHCHVGFHGVQNEVRGHAEGNSSNLIKYPFPANVDWKIQKRKIKIAAGGLRQAFPVINKLIM